MKGITIVFIMFFSQLCFSQMVDKPEVVERINKDSKEYLLSKGEIDIKNNNEKFFIQEIVEDKILGYTHKGIYRLYTNKSPSFTYIILKKGKNFKIIDLKNFSKSLKEISEFLSSGFSDKVVAKYLEEILKVYNYNHYDEKIRM